MSTDERQQTERKAHKVIVRLTSDEREVYDRVIDDYIESKGGIVCDFLGEESIPKGAHLGLIQKKRMVASSVNAYSFYTANDCDVDAFCEDVASLTSCVDSKIDCISEIFKGVQKAGGNKVIIFTIFKFTARYLSIMLEKSGCKVFSIHGDIKIQEREQILKEFRACCEFCVLISTEVGSEGLDMQFCSHLINYDLPWNPMVVEQRIGRIDRFGQEAEQVHIYNLVIENSIQELIYDRLLERVGVFRGTIGELEMILEEDDIKEQLSHLEQDLYGMYLSKEAQKRKVLDLAKAMETQKIHLEHVEEGLTNALSNDIYFQNEISKIRDHKLYVTEEELKNYVRMIVSEKLKSCDFVETGEKEYAFSVPKSTPKALTSFLIEHQPIGADYENLFRSYSQRIQEDFIKQGKIILTFDQQHAFKYKEIDYVNIYNPIIVAAAVYFKKAIEGIGKTFKLTYNLPENSDLERGLYFLAVYVVSTHRVVMGKQVSSDILVPVLYNVNDDLTINDPDVNMAIFGAIQEEAVHYNEVLEIEVSKDAYFNMESDFTVYITEFMERRKGDISIKDEAQKQLRLRQLKEHFNARMNKIEEEINNLNYNLTHYTNDEKERQKILNDIRLAENRYKMQQDAMTASIDRINTMKAPSLSYSLISLSKLIIK